MPPQTVMLIRHAEKPTDGIAGVDRHGRLDEADLTVRGWQRAGALGQFFAPIAGHAPRTGMAVPTHLIAPEPDSDHPSKRAKHTLLPLAGLLGLEIRHGLGRGDERVVVDAIRAALGVVLVAWEHKAIATIITHLTEGAVDPPHWPDDRFDMVLVLTGAPDCRLTQHPQVLLAGDRTAPFPAGVH